MANAASEHRRSVFYTKGKCFQGCEATLSVGEANTELYVCKEQLSKASEYFRVMFCEDFKEKNEEQYHITDETPENMICFFNAIDPNPKVWNITDKSVELLMRLADKYQCDLLEEILKHHITVYGPNCKSSTIIMNWLEWALRYHMTEETVKICLSFPKIDDESIELLMQLCDQFKCDMLKERLHEYIEENEPKCVHPSIILKWLIWSVKYHMSEKTIKICLPAVAWHVCLCLL